MDNLIKAVRLANLDGLKSIEISMKDLVSLVNKIQDDTRVKRLEKEVNRLNISLAKSELKHLDRPISLDFYC